MEKLADRPYLKSCELLPAKAIDTYLDLDSFKSLDSLNDKDAVDKFHTAHLCALSKIVGEMLNLYYVPFEKPYLKTEIVLNELLGNGVFTNWITITGCNFGNFDNEVGDASLFEFFISYKGHSYKLTSINETVQNFQDIAANAKLENGNG